MSMSSRHKSEYGEYGQDVFLTYFVVGMALDGSLTIDTESTLSNIRRIDEPKMGDAIAIINKFSSVLERELLAMAVADEMEWRAREHEEEESVKGRVAAAMADRLKKEKKR